MTRNAIPEQTVKIIFGTVPPKSAVKNTVYTRRTSGLQLLNSCRSVTLWYFLFFRRNNIIRILQKVSKSIYRVFFLIYSMPRTKETPRKSMFGVFQFYLFTSSVFLFSLHFKTYGVSTAFTEKVKFTVKVSAALPPFLMIIFTLSYFAVFAVES